MRVAIFLFISLFKRDLNAQIIVGNTTHITVDQGLSQNSVYTIFQDSKGLFWFSTADGINKFDGYTFTVFKNKSNDNKTISCNSDANIGEDKWGQIWFTHNKGVSIYSPIFNSFTNIDFQKHNPSSYVKSPIIGSDSKGDMWLWMADYGLKCFDKNGKLLSFKNEKTINDRFGQSLVFAGFITNDKLFLLSAEGLIVVNMSTFEIQFDKTINQLTSFQKLEANSYLFGSQHKVIVYNTASLKSRPVQVDGCAQSIDFMQKVDDTTVFMGSKNEDKFWVFTWPSSTVKLQNIYNSNFKEKHTECVFVDRSKNLWVGSNFNGITKYNYPLKKIQSIKNETSFNLVKAIIEDDNGNVYVANYDYGIAVYNSKGDLIKTLKQCTHTLAFAPFTAQFIVGYDLNLGGVYLINTTTFETKLLNTLNDAAAKTTSFPFFAQNKDFVFYVSNNCVYKLRKLETAKQEFVCKINPEKSGTLQLGLYNQILIGGIGYIEIYNPKNAINKFIKLPNGAVVKCLLLKDINTYYIGTSMGLFLFDLQWKQVGFYNSLNGLKNEFVYGLLEDEFHHVWISTNNGIFKFYPEKKSFKHLTKADGLLSSEFNSGAYYKNKNHKLFFGGVNGLDCFYAKDIKENKTAAVGIITKLYVNDNERLIQNNLILNPNENTISFEFASNEYTNTSLNEYQYFLEGADKNWVYAKGKHFARYTNLPDGNYVFKLKCSNNEGFYGAQILEYPFTILTPFYKTWWFKTFMGLLFLGLIVSVFYVIYKRKLAKQLQLKMVEAELQKQRIRFSRDLHDNIGSRTSLLIKNLESLKKDNAASDINHLQSNAADILQNLRETVWAMNEGSLSIESLADKITQFTQDRLPIDSNIKLEMTQNIAADRQLSAEDFLNIYRICQETINNAIKYSEAAVLQFEFVFMESSLLKITIADNGIGFDLNNTSMQQYGIQNMKNRAEESNIDLAFKTSNGTKVVLSKQF